jgi:hypothetical protein
VELARAKSEGFWSHRSAGLRAVALSLGERPKGREATLNRAGYPIVKRAMRSLAKSATMGFLLRRKNLLDDNCAMHYIDVVGPGACRRVTSSGRPKRVTPRPRSRLMTSNFDEIQKFGKEQLEAASSVAASLAKGFQTIAAETTDYSKKSIESNSAYVEKLLGAKSLDNAIQIQSEYAKSAYEGFVAQATKIGELYTILAKEAFKPVETVFAKVQAVASTK